MSVADALLLASLAPGQRRLRVALHPEPSWPMTALVSAGVASFFLAYFGVLVLFFLVGLPSPHASRLDGMSYTLSADTVQSCVHTSPSPRRCLLF